MRKLIEPRQPAHDLSRPLPAARVGRAGLCLAIVVNAIIAWNTIYIDSVLNDLRSGDQLIITSQN